MRQQFLVLGIPKAQPRQRFRQVTTKAGRTFAMTYQPADAAQYKDNLRSQVVSQAPRLIERDVPIRLLIEAFLPRPQAHFNSKGLLKANAPRYCTKKPDADNVKKAIMDGLTGIVFERDENIVDARLIKWYCGHGEQPRCIIDVEDIPLAERLAFEAPRQRGYEAPLQLF